MAKKKSDTVSSAVAKAAAVLGRMGGRKGGPARARVLTQRRRTEIARQGGLARQAKK